MLKKAHFLILTVVITSNIYIEREIQKEGEDGDILLGGK